MARSNPIGKIKDLTTETLKAPRTVAGKALDQAKGAAAAGLSVADSVTRGAVSTVGGLVQQRRGGSASASGSDSPAPSGPAETESTDSTGADATPEPVNVVEELGLDPAPADEPAQPTDGGASSEPETSIDAAADPTTVDATPADLAKKATAKKSPATKAPAKKAPAKKAAAKKSSAKKAPAGKSPAKQTADRTAASTNTAGQAPTTPGDTLPPRPTAPGDA